MQYNNIYMLIFTRVHKNVVKLFFQCDMKYLPRSAYSSVFVVPVDDIIKIITFAFEYKRKFPPLLTKKGHMSIIIVTSQKTCNLLLCQCITHACAPILCTIFGITVKVGYFEQFTSIQISSI